MNLLRMGFSAITGLDQMNSLKWTLIKEKLKLVMSSNQFFLGHLKKDVQLFKKFVFEFLLKWII